MNENGIENNSIKILNSVSNDSEKLKEQLNLLVQAKKNADEAVKAVIAVPSTMAAAFLRKPRFINPFLSGWCPSYGQNKCFNTDKNIIY